MIKSTIPILAVPNIGQAIAYYRERLGFRVTVEPTAGEKYAVLICGEASIHLTEMPIHHESVPHGAMGVFVVVDDVDALYDSFQTNGACHQDFPRDLGNIREHAPENKPYGFRDMIFVDPYGHRFCIAQPIG